MEIEQDVLTIDIEDDKEIILKLRKIYDEMTFGTFFIKTHDKHKMFRLCFNKININTKEIYLDRFRITLQEQLVYTGKGYGS